MSVLINRIAEVLRAHPDVIEKGGYADHPCCAEAGDHKVHVAEQIEIAMRDMGIVGFIYNDESKRVPRVYTDADAEVWADRP